MSYQSPISLPDEHMRLVGIIAAHWEHLDLILQRAVAEVMNLSPTRVALLTANISVINKCDLLTVYARPLKEINESDWKTFNQIMIDIKSSYAARNRYIHAAWEGRDGTLYRHEIRTTGGKLAQTDVPVETSELGFAAQQIIETGSRFAVWMQDHGLLQPQRSPDE